MRKRDKLNLLPGIFVPLVVAGLLLCFLSGISNVSHGRSQEDKQRLEDVLREASVACYATEGFYPPSLSYLEDYYGVQIDRRRFVVQYSAIAENLIPDITVLEK